MQPTRERFLPLDSPSLALLRDAQVSLAGVSETRRGYSIARRAPGFHLLLYTLEGVGELQCDADKVLLSTNSVFAAPAHSTYSYKPATACWRIAWIHLRRRPVWQEFDRMAAGSRPTNEGPAVAAMEAILREDAEARADSPRLMELHAEALLLHLRREVGREADPARRDVLMRLGCMWRRVEEDLARDWSVSSMARLTGFSDGHLSRLVREHEGHPPLRALTHRRMRRAEMLLRESDLKLDAIAAAVGYADAYTFSAAFKKWKGVAPSALRKAGDGS